MTDTQKCPKCNKPIKEGPLLFGGEDCDFDDEQATGPRISVCGCGVRFSETEQEGSQR